MIPIQEIKQSRFVRIADRQFNRPRVRLHAAILILAALLCWMSRYWLSSGFGLYEDDYVRIPSAMAMTIRQVPHFIKSEIGIFQQGRPLHPIFIGLLGWAGAKIHGLQAMYWTGFAIWMVNAALFYLLLLRLELSRHLAAVALIAFAVFPGDVSQAFLTHALGVQPSLMMILLAMHGLLSGWKFVPYALAGLALLCYETPVPAFIAFPLLLPKWDRRRIVQHAAFVTGLIGIAGAVRVLAGEGRVTGLSAGDAASEIARQVTLGPLVSLSSYAWRPLTEGPYMDRLGIALGMASILVVVCMLWRSGKVEDESRRLARLLAGGLAWTSLSYLLAFTVDAADIDGRASRVHFAAGIGCAIVLASLYGLLAKRVQQRVLVAATAVLMSLSVASGVAVQRDYAWSWQQQRILWTDLVSLTKDAGPGEVILIEHDDALPRARHLSVLEWHFPMVLGLVYWMHAPERAPEVWLAKDGWRSELNGNGLTLDAKVKQFHLWWVRDRKIPRSGLIVLDGSSGKLRRETPPRPAANLRHGVLYPVLIDR